jgi:hypothetical protein
MHARFASRMHLATSHQQHQSALRKGKHSRTGAARCQTQPSIFHLPGRSEFGAGAQCNDLDAHCPLRRWENYSNFYAYAFWINVMLRIIVEMDAEIEVGD